MSARKLEVIADPDRPTIVTRRVFDAPRALVFEAWTRPEHLKRWLGPKDRELVICEIDLRVGGTWRWVFGANARPEASFHGEYREIVRPERIVTTFIYDPFPDEVAIDTLTLEERDGRTTATSLSVHPTIQSRDAHLAAGMEAGVREGYAALDDVLAELVTAGGAGSRSSSP
jgi:uncharacterized protein YndB with AHSA1/START domain